MRQFPAVALVGARQVGKTTLARIFAEKSGKKSVYFDLERPSDRAKLADAELVLSQYHDHCVIVDEAQVMPELFSVLRPLIDQRRRPGRFLLLGSVSPDLVRGISQTLAGRIAEVELPPVSVPEALAAGKTAEHLWFRGGFPEALKLRSHSAWSDWAESYFHTFIHRDVNLLMGETLSPQLVEKIWLMLSGIHGSILNQQLIAKSLGISRATVAKYLDFLEGSFIIFRLQPWLTNVTKRVVRSPKFYFRDTAVLHHLWRINTPAELRLNISAGHSWEGFVIGQIRQLMPRHLNMYFYRTHQGAETDVVLVRGQKPVACLEIKIGESPALTRGWHEVVSDLKTKTNFVVTRTGDDYKLLSHTRACSLEVFLKKYLPKL